MNSPENLSQEVVYKGLQDIVKELSQQLTKALSLQRQSHQPFENFSNADGNVTGSTVRSTGDKVDLFIESSLNASQMGFSTMRLTTWLNSSLKVPHLAFEFGTVPHLFFYMDYVPRVDLWTDISYVERYYEPVNPTYLELRENPQLSLFISNGLYIRQFQSPAHLCFTCPKTEASLSLISLVAQEMFHRWLGWVNEGEPVPAEAQADLAKRDLQMRRIAAERDPGNVTAERIFGAELGQQLVRAFWDRDLDG